MAKKEKMGYNSKLFNTIESVKTIQDMQAVRTQAMPAVESDSSEEFGENSAEDSN